MVSEIRIYFEGSTKLREGFNKLIKPVIDQARQNRVRFNLIAGGSKEETIKDFKRASISHKDASIIMLIDSDRAYDSGLLMNVRSQVGVNVQDEQIHFMVQVMESWFLADRDALKQYYGQNFQESRLPQNSDLERISKSDVIAGLEDATRDTSKGKYHKTKHAPQLLSKLNADNVCSAAPSCKRLFDSLQQLISRT